MSKIKPVIISAAVITGLFIPIKPCFVVCDSAVVGAFDLADGGEFAISYMHSVNRSVITDCYRRKGMALVLTESRFSSFGAGVEADAALTEDGLGLVLEADRELEEIGLYVGRIAGHTLHINGGEYRLADFAEPGTLLKLRMERMSAAGIVGSRLRRTAV